MQTIEYHFPSFGNNPYHDHHIKEYMQYTNGAMEDITWQINDELKNIYDALSALESRVERMEAATPPSNNNNSKKDKPELVEADLYVTKDSLRKLKKSIMNMFR